jgi:hypothetical protein
MRLAVKIFFVLSVIACFMLSAKVCAQGDTSSAGNYVMIQSVEFTPTIAQASKIKENPVIIDSTQRIPTLNYSISSKRVSIPFMVEPIAPAKMEGEPLAKLYRALVKVGFGNYATPYGEFWYNNLRSREYNYGLRLKHISSSATLADKGYSGYSNNEVELYGKKFLKKHTLWGDAGYFRDVVHAYGYDTSLHNVSKAVTYNRYNLFTGRAGLMSHFTDSAKINHNLLLDFYNFSDSYESSETNFKAQGIFSGYYEKQLIRLNAGIDYYNNRMEADTLHNTIVFLNPSLTAKGDKWRASLGIDVRLDVSDEARFYFYPSVDFSYDPFDHILIPYAGITGGLDKNSYRSYAEANPFVMHELTLKNSNRKFEVYGGLKGSVSSNSAYDARFSYAAVSGMPFFVNDTTETMRNRFTVVYDSVKVMNVHGELSIQNTEKLKFIMKGDYTAYNTTHELRAWHRPELEVTFTTNYNLRDKIVAKADIFVIGKQYARVNVFDSTAARTVFAAKELKGIVDLNIGLEYRYTKILSAWVSFNNIAATRYYRWNNYPMQRFNIMGGVSFAF